MAVARRQVGKRGWGRERARVLCMQLYCSLVVMLTRSILAHWQQGVYLKSAWVVPQVM